MRTPIETQAFGSPSAPALYFVSGWAMPASLSMGFIRCLSHHFHVVVANLPGVTSDEQWFKRNRFGPNYDIEALTEQLIRSAPKPCWWIGWSLGGEIATYVAARRSSCVEGLITIASTPKFTTSADWPLGVAPEVLASFADLARTNPVKAVSRFLLQQTQGIAGGKELAKQLQSGIPSELIDKEALYRGLDLLASLDVRRELELVDVPVLQVFGERDQLVDGSAGASILEKNALIKRYVVDQCGHQPHIESPSQVATLIQQFINDHTDTN